MVKTTLNPSSSSKPLPKALLFDVFGTTVFWQNTVENSLYVAAEAELSSQPVSPPAAPVSSSQSAAEKASVFFDQKTREKRAKAIESYLSKGRDPAAGAGTSVSSKRRQFWVQFATEWRASYSAFTRTYPGPESATESIHAHVEGQTASSPSQTTQQLMQAWISVDQHHYSALVTLLAKYGLTTLFPPAVLTGLVHSWHDLPPHADTVQGLAALQKLGIQTATLGNGNSALIRDLVNRGVSSSNSSGIETTTANKERLPFDHLFSAEDFAAYKTNPAVYLGAVQKLGLKREQVGLVASHMNDCLGAAKLGLRTWYVHRPLEEEWDEAFLGEVVASGLLDGVVGEEGYEGMKGFEALAKLLRGTS
jgi:2-haloacid dehalogenase